MFQRPPRNAAILDLRAAIRAGTQHDPHSIFLAKFQHAPHIRHAGEIKFPLLRLHLVPEQIKADRVQAHRLRLFDARVPILRLHTTEVHLARDQHRRLAVYEELMIARLELVRFAIRHDARDSLGG